MNRSDGRPPDDLEARIRDAFGAAAETITPADLPGQPPVPARTPRAARWLRAREPRRHWRTLAPAAAAAVVAAIAVAAVVVPQLGGPAHHPAVSPMAAVGGPAFFVGIAEQSGVDVARIYRTATGQVVATIHSPDPARRLLSVTRLGGDRTYVVADNATSPHDCSALLYRFTISASGQPSPLTRLGPKLTGTVNELTSSANGQVLGFTMSGCRLARPTGVINLATGNVTRWSFRLPGVKEPTGPGSLSLNADGSVLGFAAQTGQQEQDQAAFTVPTSTPPGDIMRGAHKVVQPPKGVFREIISPSGAQMLVETEPGRQHYKIIHGRRFPVIGDGPVVLQLYRVSDGRLIRGLGKIGPGGSHFSELWITTDTAGRHLLAYGYLDNDYRVLAVDTGTGHRAVTSASGLIVEGALTTLAW